MREEELKFEVHGMFTLPGLTDLVPEGGDSTTPGQLRLRATYYDTDDLRLARMGITLRHRTGENGPPWHLKLPTNRTGVRDELSQTGGTDIPPASLTRLVTAWIRSAQLKPVATLRTDRDTVLLRDADGAVLAEVVDDMVSVLQGRKVVAKFREIEAERGKADPALMTAIADRLTEAGAVGGTFVPKVIRALGPGATAEPDLAKPGKLHKRPSAGDVATHALRRTVRRLLDYDIKVRRVEPDAVHQMRVCCRRLRSDLRTFAALVDPDWVAPLQDELRWLAADLGAVRDLEVLRARLVETASADPVSGVDSGAVDRIDALLSDRESDTLTALQSTLDSPRYAELLETLVDAANHPRLTPLATHPTPEVLLPMIATAWARLEKAGRKLHVDGPDETWHAARIKAKRARYATEAAASTIGSPATKLADACASVQNVLGEHQDAATAAEVWIRIGTEHPDDVALVLTCGRLIERERASVRAARAEFASVWHQATRPKLVRWLHT